MEQAAKMLRESLSYRLVQLMMSVVRQSVTAKLFHRVSEIIANSRVASSLSLFFNRPFIAENSACIRAFTLINRKLLSFRVKSAAVFDESMTCRTLRHSKAFGILSRYLILSAVFFVFIDELGRSLFGSVAVFGYWDEAYLLICFLFLISRWLLGGRDRISPVTPLDIPIFFLAAVSFFLYLTHSRYPQIGFEGMRTIVEFILWFYVFSRILDTDGKAYFIIRGLVLTGGILSVHGIFQAVTGVKMPANWTDAAEGAESTRVYSIVGSPNILGSLMVLIIPLGISLVFQKNLKPGQKTFFLGLTVCMGVCLILTLSRGAWVGMLVGLVIFCIGANPGLLAGLAVGGGLTLLVPSVWNRVRYMLSPQYIISSMTGGRLLRYGTGLQMFRENLLFGVGMGHFGGAVAMNHKDLFPNTFYMDNYWLKTAVEMGLVGLIAFSVLLLFLIIWSIRGINNQRDSGKKLILIGAFSGLAGVIVHNFFENVFEVPYMVIYFWMIAAVIMYYGFKSPQAGNSEVPPSY